MLTVTSFTAALLALMFVALTWNVVQSRFRVEAVFGDGGDDLLNRAIRAHGNFAEYVPLFLILLALQELAGVSSFLLVLQGVALLAARGMHAYSLLKVEVANPKRVRYRIYAMRTQLGLLVTGAVILLAMLLL